MVDLFLSFAFLASSITVNKILLYSLSPTLLVALRMLIGGIILLFYAFWSKAKFSLSQIKKDIFLLLIITLATTLIPAQLKAYALQHMVSSKAAFYGTLDPFITAIYAYFIWSDTLTIKKLLGMVLGLIGLTIMTIASSGQELIFFSYISYPELAAVGAIIISRFGWILIQKKIRENTYTPIQINSITMLFSGFINLSIVVLFGNYTTHAPSTMFNLYTILLLAYTSIIGNVFGYTLYASTLKHYSATFISLSGFTIPLLVSIFGWLFLGERLSIAFFIACLLTFAGLGIFFLDERNKKFKNLVRHAPIQETLD